MKRNAADGLFTKPSKRWSMKKLYLGASILALFLFAFQVDAGTPLEAVQRNVNKVLEVLRDPALKAETAKETKKRKLRAIYEQMFDEIELARRTLARNWNALDLAQRQEFVQLFRQVLEKAYIDKILSYTNEKVAFDKETMLAENQAEVQTRIITSSKEIPIFYRVIMKDGAWKVYDVVIEGVSLVQNYRTQFNDILAKSSAEELLQILRKKVKES
jgi:phospholipid transport system substrate-binding protein